MAYSDVSIDVTAKQIEDAVKSIKPLKKQINDIPNALPQNLRFLVNDDGKSITAYWTELVENKYDGLYTKRFSSSASFDGMSAGKGIGALVKNIESTDSALSKWHLELNYEKTEQTHVYRFLNWSWDGSKIIYAHPISCDFMYQSLKEKIDNIETGDVDLSGYQKSLTAGNGIAIPTSGPSANVISVQVANGLAFNENKKLNVSLHSGNSIIFDDGIGKGLKVNTDVIASKEFVEEQVDDIETALENKADIPNGFSLVESMTIEEDGVHQAAFENLNLERAYLFASFPADTEKKVVGGRFMLPSGYQMINFYTADGISTSKKYFFAFAQRNNDVWTEIWKKSSTRNDINNTGGRTYVDQSGFFKDKNFRHNINKVFLNAGDSATNVYFPIGTKIELYGVIAK